jgi:tetratricopeptide (TPR) repeat protein
MSRSPVSASVSPEAYLQKARHAQSWATRAKYATKGLAQPGVDQTTQAMLLRQLYLAHMETRRFEQALEVAQQMMQVGVLPDAARQDAARACLGLGQTQQAVDHLRLAGRVAPASRRAFHLWTLGSTLYLLGRASEAVGVLERAARWATTAKPLYLAQHALARLANGEAVTDLAELHDRLTDAPCGQGYGQFVLGELSFQMGSYEDAEQHLEGFVKRTTGGRVALSVGLSRELDRARELLEKIGSLAKPD